MMYLCKSCGVVLQFNEVVEKPRGRLSRLRYRLRRKRMEKAGYDYRTIHRCTRCGSTDVVSYRRRADSPYDDYNFISIVF